MSTLISRGDLMPIPGIHVSMNAIETLDPAGILGDDKHDVRFSYCKEHSSSEWPYNIESLKCDRISSIFTTDKSLGPLIMAYLFIDIHFSLLIKQESPPAWTQEAYRPPRSHSNFLLWGGGSLDKNFFSQSEHVSSQIWCQKFFPLREGEGSLDKKIFPQSEHVSSQIWCQKFFPLLRLGTPPAPPENLRPGTPLPPTKNLRPGTPPPRKSETWDTPPPPVQAWIGYPPPEMWTDWNYYLSPSFGWRAVIMCGCLPFRTTWEWN